MDNNDLFELGQQMLLFTSYLALSTQWYPFHSMKPHKTNRYTSLPWQDCTDALQIPSLVLTFTLHFSLSISMMFQAHCSDSSLLVRITQSLQMLSRRNLSNSKCEEVMFLQISKMQHNVKRFHILVT